jgi:hypothetical protein
MPEVFINYRTGDGDEAASLIEEVLSSRFGEEKIFRAAKSIVPGEPFPEALLRAVRRSSVLLAIVGKQWSSHPRLRDEDDWVRREILEAYACGVRVIPVLKGRETARLNVALLPVELAKLAEAQSLRLDIRDSGADLARIGDTLADLVPSLKEADRGATLPPSAPGAVNNAAGEVHGPAIQGRDFTGDVGTVIKGIYGSVHTGKGDIYHGSQHFSGIGNALASGDEPDLDNHPTEDSDQEEGER